MKKHENILKVSIYLAGLLCLFIWISARSLPVMNLIMREKIIPEHWEFTRWGEMYYFNYIRHFKNEDLPAAKSKYRFTDKHPTIDEADILIFGDSFFDFARQKTFPELLADSLNKKVYYERFFFPLESFVRKDFSNSEPKLLIYETVERDIGIRFNKPHTFQVYTDTRSKVRRVPAAVKDWIFYDMEEEMYNKMLKGNFLTTDVYSYISTFKFDRFGYISSITPKYCMENEEEPWLFFHKQVNDEISSFYYQHTDTDIENYCNNIADLAQKVKTHYNMDFLFIAIPNKYTVYHSMINDDEYNELLPRVCEGLEKRGVSIVKLYDDYMNSDEVLYYRTDTHWNKKGIDIAINKTLVKIDSEGNLKN